MNLNFPIEVLASYTVYFSILLASVLANQYFFVKIKTKLNNKLKKHDI
jgi:hypothetical protein